MKHLEKFFIWSAGFDVQTAENCTSSEKNKMMIVGMSLFIAPLVALFSYGYAFSFIFGNTTAAIIGGSVSALVILMIDRSILALGRPGHLSFGMVARIFLAVIIGFLLAEPLTLKIFSDSIVEEQYQELKSKEEKIINEADQKYKELLSKIDFERKKLDELQRGYVEEMDGTGGSRIRNQGPIYERKYQDYLDYRQLFLDNQRNTTAFLKQVEQEKNQELSSLQQAQAKGIVGQLRSLHNLSNKEPIVFWASWLIRLFFCLIELIPIFIKLTPTGDRALYYNLVDQKDREYEKINKITQEERIKLLEKHEKLRFVKQYSELCNQELQVIAEAKEKDSVFLMRTMQTMVDKKLELQQKVIEKIKEPNLLNETLTKLEEIHFGFSSLIKKMLERSNLNFSQSKS